VGLQFDFREPSRPDIVLFDYGQKSISLLEISCPADINIQTKENEKLHKYQPLASDFHHSMYNMPVQIIPIVIGHSGIMTSRC